jgi:hydrogenase maturation protease
MSDPGRPGTSPALVLFACGNPSRRDDALGPALLARAETRGLGHGRTAAFVPEFQLQIENALDLRPAVLTLFIDAAADGAPVAFSALAAAADASVTSHALSPAALLDVYRRGLGQPPPPAFVLAVRGYDFELGEGLSKGAAANLERAWSLLDELLATPTVEAWQAKVHHGR